MQQSEKEIEKVIEILAKRSVFISHDIVKKHFHTVEETQTLFPRLEQRALLVQMLQMYETKKKQIVLLEEIANSDNLPVTYLLAALAEDWPGMSNSILGIVHIKEQNVVFIKGLTIELEQKPLSLVLIAFQISSPEALRKFQKIKDDMIEKIKEAAEGSIGKKALLEEETLKMAIFNEIIVEIKKRYKEPDIETIIGQNSETLKFFASRSREYLEERKISDLTNLILTNHVFQKIIREKKADYRIDIANFETKYEKLTGITFACIEQAFSIEDFLKALNHIIPGHIIKHHKSFVTYDNILVYRIEILDSDGKPLSPQMITSVRHMMEKLICVTGNENICHIKSVGGVEQYARALIPFLMEELQTTGITQAYLSVKEKTEFLMTMKLIIVAYENKNNEGPGRLLDVIEKFDKTKGVDVVSFMPSRIYKGNIEVNIVNLNIELAEFLTIPLVYAAIKDIIRQSFGNFRDFDQGLREIDMAVFNEVSQQLKEINQVVLRQIFFNIDEIFRIETPVHTLVELFKMCRKNINHAENLPLDQMVVNYRDFSNDSKHIASDKTVYVISCSKDRHVLSKIIQEIKWFGAFFTKFEWRQKLYRIIILRHENKALPQEKVDFINHNLKENFPDVIFI